MDLKELKTYYEKEGKKGIINTFITMHGGKNGVVKRYGSIKGFESEMKKAGFSRSYISEVVKSFK